jgi:hypothetical protein
MIIVIDDERTFKKDPNLDGFTEWVYARNSVEGIAAIVNAWTDFTLRYGNMVDLYLDHDLGENDTIMPVVDFLYVAGNATVDQGFNPVGAFPLFINNIFIHSQNPTAGDTIIPLLSPIYHNVQRIALPELV